MTLATVTLRLATWADAPALASLARDSFVAAFGSMYSERDLADFLEQTKSLAATRAQIADHDSRICLAEAKGRLLGYCKLGLTSGFPEYAKGARPIELKQLYTDPAAIGRGIGTILMDWALAEAGREGADEMQLSVWSGNMGGQRFYARYGFAKVADIEFRVGAQIDEEFLFARLL